MSMKSSHHMMFKKQMAYLVIIAWGCQLLMFGPAWAAPQGGQVTSGAAKINQSGNVTTINQATQRAAINWQSFSTRPQETVNFHQPNAAAIALNRVIGNERSILEGALNANGRVFLINSNGILFAKGSTVNTAGFIASTLNLTDKDFNAGSYVFKKNNSTGSVINMGTITAKEGGYVALLGPAVSNQGVIAATRGSVAFASGDKVTLNFNGDSLINVTVDEGTLNALVENKQAIYADGGQVILTAKAADDLLGAQVNNSGIIQARTISDLTGEIKLLADGGTTIVDGILDASAPYGGDGGFIETSGDRVKIADGTFITTKSATGKNGTWLIDPTDFTIYPGNSAQTISGIGVMTLAKMLEYNTVTIATSASGNGKGDINIDATMGAGNTRNVTANALPNSLTLIAANNIYVNAPIYWNTNTLTLNAGKNIYVNANMVAKGESVGFAATYGRGINADGTPMGLYMGQNAQYNFAGGIYFSGPTMPTVTLNGTPYTVINNASDLTNINSNLSGNYVLGSDIRATEAIGSAATPFTGNFNGFGHQIYAPLVATGVFDTIGSSGTVSNLNVFARIAQPISGTITTQAVGALANYNEGKIINIIGGGSINYTTATLSSGSTFYAGGLVGVNSGLIAQSCVSNFNNTSNTIYTTNIAGGVVGYNEATGVIRDSGASISFKNPTGTDSDGNTVQLNSATYVGGLVGVNAGTIEYSYAIPWFYLNDTNSTTGGLVGWNKTGGVIDQSYVTGMTGGSNAKLAGFAWENNGAITNSYTTLLNRTQRQYWTAGFVNINTGTISNDYTRVYSSITTSGSLCGFACTNTGTIKQSYWSATTGNDGTAPTDNTTAKNLTASQATTLSSYAGFDPSIWSVSKSGYPILGNIIIFVTNTVGSSFIPYYGSVTNDVTSLALFGRGLQEGDDFNYVYQEATNNFTNPFKVTALDNGYIDAGTYTASRILSSSVYKRIMGTVMVNPLPVTFKIANKAYDGTTAATVNGITGFTADGRLIGDQTLKYTYSSADFSQSNVGTDLTVTVNNAVLSDGDNGGQSRNYTVSANIRPKAAITPKALTAVFTGMNKTYNGASDANVSFVGLNGVISGDTVFLNSTPTTGTFSDANVGTGKTVSISGLTLIGSSSGNYTIDTATTAASITPLVLQLSGVKTYDGKTTISGSSIAASNAVSGDTVTFSGVATIASAADGTQPITSVNGLTVSNPNYILPTETGKLGTVIIGGNNLVQDPIAVATGLDHIDTTTKANTTTIYTKTDKAIIDWLRFNIAANETVDFKQPHTYSIVLNRVTTGLPSVIYGTLISNGKVFLLNSNGILFGAGSSVNTAGLVASALNISKTDFLNDHYVFTVSNARGSVINNAQITIADDGFLALVSNHGVTNSGSLSAPGGKILLVAAGNLTLTLNPDDNSLTNYIIAGLDGTTTIDGVVNVAAASGNGGLIETAGKGISLGDGYQLGTGNNGTWSVSLPTITIGSGGNLTSTFVQNNLVLRNLSLNAMSGDITINDAVTWSANTTLTLSAINDIYVNNAITANGVNAVLAMNYGGYNSTTVTTPAAGTDYFILTPASYSGTVLDANGYPVAMKDTSGGVYGEITFTNSANTHGLKINGNTYTLIHSMNDLDHIDGLDAVTGNYYNEASGLYDIPAVKTIDGDVYFYDRDTGLYDIAASKKWWSNDLKQIWFNAATGHYALAKNLNAMDNPYPMAPLVTLDGTLAGLGHAIDNLNISASGSNSNTSLASASEIVALIGVSYDGSIIRDMGVTNANIRAVLGGPVLRKGAAILVAQPVGTIISRDYVNGSLSVSNGFTGSLAGVSWKGSHFHSSYADVNVSVSNGNAGGLVGVTYNGGSVVNSSFKGTIDTNWAAAGGLIGIANSTYIANSYAIGTNAMKKTYIGIDAGGNFYNADVMHPASNAGGLVGEYHTALPSNYIINSFAIENIATLGGNAGGLVARLVASADSDEGKAGMTIRNCYWRGDIYTVSGTVGGLIGIGRALTDTPLIIDHSYAHGRIKVDGKASDVGGLFGKLEDAEHGIANIVSNSFADVNINAPEATNVGGMGGSSYLINIINSSAKGKIVGGKYVGGLMGKIIGQQYYDSTLRRYVVPYATISHSYSDVTISGTGYVGGLSGSMAYIKVINSFWNKENNPSPASTGFKSSSQLSNSEGVSSKSFQNGDIQHYLDGTIDQVLAARDIDAARQAAFEGDAGNLAGSTVGQTLQRDTNPSSEATALGEGQRQPSLDDHIVFADSDSYGAHIRAISADGVHFDLEDDSDDRKKRKND